MDSPSQGDAARDSLVDQMVKVSIPPSPATVPRLGDATLRYMAALYDPRGCFEETWIPQGAVLSQKSKIFSRGQFSTGTTGVGFMMVGGRTANDIAFTTCTGSTSVGTTATLASAFTNLSTAARLNAPFATAQFTSTAGGVQSRIVGMSLYAKYVGTELNKGGDMLLVEEPDHLDLLGYSYETAMGLDGAKRVKVSNDWQHVCRVPATDAELDFRAAEGLVGSGGRTFGIFVSSAGAPQPFDFEIFAHVEYSGTPARSPSVSFNDPIGFQAVYGASDMFQQLDSELGLQGFVDAVHSQLLNQSLPATHPANGNWTALLSFLPQLKQLAMPLVRGAAGFAGKQLVRWAGANMPTGTAVTPVNVTQPSVVRSAVPRQLHPAVVKVLAKSKEKKKKKK
jgi:hypothetical protein